jgi:hypothetical protein
MIIAPAVENSPSRTGVKPIRSSVISEVFQARDDKLLIPEMRVPADSAQRHAPCLSPRSQASFDRK